MLGIIARALRTGEISSDESKYYDFRTMPMATMPVQERIPFWYPGSPVTAGRFGLKLMFPGPIPQDAYDLYVETWHAHRHDPIRLDGPDDRPTVGATMVVAIDRDESVARDIITRGMHGLMRRTHAVHRWDADVLGDAGLRRGEVIALLHRRGTQNMRVAAFDQAGTLGVLRRADLDGNGADFV